ncbi:hypothetical protein ACTFIY_012147 [Dictyostelium cf. discoideum]
MNYGVKYEPVSVYLPGWIHWPVVSTNYGVGCADNKWKIRLKDQGTEIFSVDFLINENFLNEIKGHCENRIITIETDIPKQNNFYLLYHFIDWKIKSKWCEDSKVFFINDLMIFIICETRIIFEIVDNNIIIKCNPGTDTTLKLKMKNFLEDLKEKPLKVRNFYDFFAKLCKVSNSVLINDDGFKLWVYSLEYPLFIIAKNGTGKTRF